MKEILQKRGATSHYVISTEVSSEAANEVEKSRIRSERSERHNVCVSAAQNYAMLAYARIFSPDPSMTRLAASRERAARMT